jgi:hypothetical protein
VWDAIWPVSCGIGPRKSSPLSPGNFAIPNLGGELNEQILAKRHRQASNARPIILAKRTQSSGANAGVILPKRTQQSNLE